MKSGIPLCWENYFVKKIIFHGAAHMEKETKEKCEMNVNPKKSINIETRARNYCILLCSIRLSLRVCSFHILFVFYFKI